MSKDVNAGATAPSPLERVSDLVLIAGKMKPKTVIIAGGDREDDLRLVEAARDHGIVDRCILVGDEAAIRGAARTLGIALESRDVIATSSPEETAERTVERVRDGGVHLILKGNISTPILNRAMMRIVVRNTISLVTLFDTAPIAGGRPILLTDPGVTTMCSFGRMVGLIENAVEVAQAILGLDRPRVAILSANEKVIDSLPSTRLAQALSQRPWDGALVYGPLSLDLAVDPDSVGIKGLGTGGAAKEVAGRADVLVCPCLDSANILYKMIMENVKYGLGTFAGITVGVSLPYGILSRADSVETKLQSIALCSIAAERMEMGPGRGASGGRTAVSAAQEGHRVLVLQAGAAWTRIALYEGEQCLQRAELPQEALAAGAGADAAVPSEDAEVEAAARVRALQEYVRRQELGTLDAIVTSGELPSTGPWAQARVPMEPLAADAGAAGGPGRPLPLAEVLGGEAVVDERLLRLASAPSTGGPRSNLGILVAAGLARSLGVPAWVVDETEPSPGGDRGPAPGQRISHALSIREAAREMAARQGLRVEETHYAVAHLGEETTVAAVLRGGVIDSTVVRPGGLEDEEAAREIAKSIGAMSVAVGPEMEAIVLTGELTRSEQLVRSLKRQLTHLFPVLVLKDAPEMEALAARVLNLLASQTQPRAR
jgi:phosphate butyryltransferase